MFKENHASYLDGARRRVDRPIGRLRADFLLPRRVAARGDRRCRIFCCGQAAAPACIDCLKGRDAIEREGLEQLLGSYSQEATNRFVFGPVETVTTASASDVGFEFHIHREMTAVPDAVNVTICCINLKTRMRFTGEPVERSRLDLATTTFYDPAALKEWFPSCGLDCLREERSGPFALFLLKRSAR